MIDQPVNNQPPISPAPAAVPQQVASQSPQQNFSEENPNNTYDYDYRPQPERLALAWTAASRPYKKRNRQYYVTIALIVFLVSLILFFAGQFLPIAVVISIGFLAYAFSAVPPELATIQITTYGIRIDQNLYYWEEMGRFWFSEKYQQKVLNIELGRFPNQLTILLGEQDPTEVENLLSDILLQEKPPLTAFDKAASWLQEKIPLDTEA